MDPTIWGPHYWFVLHTIAFNYPMNATSIQKKVYHRFIHNLHEFLPNRTIGGIFQKLLAEHSVTPYLDSRKDFIKWMHFIHNKINERLEKPKMTLEDHYRDMAYKYAPKKTNKLRIVLILVLLLGLSGILAGFYERVKDK